MVHVVATAFASKVFPVPGGPYSSRPERHSPSDSSSGCSRGNWIVSRISFFTSCSPPTSCQDTEGICQERENLCQHLFLRCLGSSSIQYPHFPSSELCNGENKLYKHVPKHPLPLISSVSKNTPGKVSARVACSFEGKVLLQTAFGMHEGR